MYRSTPRYFPLVSSCCHHVKPTDVCFDAFRSSIATPCRARLPLPPSASALRERAPHLSLQLLALSPKLIRCPAMNFLSSKHTATGSIPGWMPCPNVMHGTVNRLPQRNCCCAKDLMSKLFGSDTAFLLTVGRLTRCRMTYYMLCHAYARDFCGSKWDVVASPEGLQFREELKDLRDRLLALSHECLMVRPRSLQTLSEYHLITHAQAYTRFIGP